MAVKKVAKKSVKAAKAAKPAKKPVKAAQKTPVKKDRLAVRVLPTLPSLSEVRRRAYRAAFSEAQCQDWGERTTATNVLSDAEKAVGAVIEKVKAGVDGYPAQRLSWLCSLMVELEDAIEHQQGNSGDDARASRNAAVSVASATRVKLAHGLLSAAGGNAAMLKQVADRNESTQTPSALETSITGLLQLALGLRRSPEGEVLADDAGLTEAFLSSASAVADSLHAANEATFGTGTQHDTQETNRVEGRVLRELNFLRVSLNRARERGVLVPNFPTVGSLKSAHIEQQTEPTPNA